jgi:hypothetical protein
VPCMTSMFRSPVFASTNKCKPILAQQGPLAEFCSQSGSSPVLLMLPYLALQDHTVKDSVFQLVDELKIIPDILYRDCREYSFWLLCDIRWDLCRLYYYIPDLILKLKRITDSRYSQN